MTADDVRRALVRIAHEVVERNHGIESLVVVGLQTGGVPLAERLAGELGRIEGPGIEGPGIEGTGIEGTGIEGTGPPAGTLDVAFYRDDIGLRPVLSEEVTSIPCDLTGRTVVLVDDVLYTGRTVRAALNALNDHGRARAVQLAVMVDRGHRELPIRPDFVGKNLPTRRDEMVDVTPDDGVYLCDVVEG